MIKLRNLQGGKSRSKGKSTDLQFSDELPAELDFFKHAEGSSAPEKRKARDSATGREEKRAKVESEDEESEDEE